MNDFLSFKCLHNFLNRSSEIWKLALSSSVAWELAKLTGTKHPYFAPIAAILCLQVTIDKSVSSAINRIIGTIGGVFLTATIAGYLGVHAWSIGLIVLLGTAITKKAKLEEQAISQVGISAMMVLIFQTQSHTYAFDRIMETVLGAFTAVAINILFFPPDFTEEAVHAFLKFTVHISDILKKQAKWIKIGSPKGGEANILHEIKTMLKDLHNTIERFEQARKSLRYNIFSKRSHEILDQISSNFFKLREVYTHLINMLQTLTEWSESGEMTQKDQKVWAEHILTLVSYIEEWKSDTINKVKSIEGVSRTCPINKNHVEMNPLLFSISKDMQKYIYPVILYNQSKQLIHDLSVSISFSDYIKKPN